MKNTQKGFALPLILVIIAALLIGGGAYVYMQNKQAKQPVVANPTTQATSTTQTTNSQTADWKTYKNNKYGFEIKYPVSYSMSSNPSDSSITFRSEACKSLVSGGGEWPTDCQSYNILVQQNKISGPEMSKTIVAGIQAEKYSDSNGMWSNGTQVLVQFQKGQNWYIQTFTFNQDKSQIAESVMNQILSTFKFTQ